MATILATPPAVAGPAAARRVPPRRGSQAFPVGLAVSALLHIALLATISFHYYIEPAAPRAALRSYDVEPAMQAYVIEPVTVGFGEPEPEPLPRRDLVLPIPLPPPIDVPVRSGRSDPFDATPAPPAPSAAERLRRGYRDPQLLAPVDRLPPEELSEADLLRLRLAYKLEMYNDSAAAEAEARLRATDWTVKDGKGGKWGVSPGKIHLGDRTLPLPFGFSPPPGRREELADQLRTWNESQAQGARVEAAQTFEQRVRAIRERQQAARDSTRKAGGR